MFQKKLAVFMLVFVCFISWHCKKETNEVLIASSPTEGEILIAPFDNENNSGKLMILDNVGNIIFQKDVVDAYNFQKWVVNGQVRYSYLEHNTAASSPIPLAITPCWGVVLDENFNVLSRVSLLPYKNRTAEDLSSIDCHEFIYLDDNHYITIAYFEKVVNNIPAGLNPATNCKVITPIIQEIINDQVVFEWEGADFAEFYTQSQEGNNFSNSSVAHDYMHINSVFVDPNDNNLICSFRNLNQIIKIERTTGNILWRLGGTNSDFALTDNMKFLRQHHATITDDNETLLIYDNGEIDERKYSRVVEFKLDEAGKTITSFKAFNVPGNIFSQYMGSVQKRGDTYFIGCGSEEKIMEVNFNTGTINFLMDLEYNTYRAFKY